MDVISFFSGAGGMDLGFVLAGHNIVWANDFDKDAANTYEYNIGKLFKHEYVVGDITNLFDTSKEMINKNLPDGDIIIGGFPCQGFSIANIDRSMKDERNYLYLELLKAISIKKPKFFILENVKGLENMSKGKILKMILDDLEVAGTDRCKVFPGDGSGYKVSYNVLNAYNYGVPQNRERVIIFGVRKDLENNFFEKNNLSSSKFKNKPRKTFLVRETHSQDSEITDTLKPYEKINNMYNHYINEHNTDYDYFKQKHPIYKSTNLSDAISDLPMLFDKNNENIANHDGSKAKVKISNRVGNRETFWNKHSPTIMGRGSGTGGPLIPPHPDKHRRFSVREVARIQTFPDNFIFKGSNSSAYRQIGNAVPVLMAYNIAKIFKDEN